MALLPFAICCHWCFEYIGLEILFPLTTMGNYDGF